LNKRRIKMMMPAIYSVGPPPERHADRMVSEMMKVMIAKRAKVIEAVLEAIDGSSDGSPRAQQKMEMRIRRAGAMTTKLRPGKRGKYLMTIYDMAGWNPAINDMIFSEDVIPEKPWIVVNLSMIESRGNGSDDVRLSIIPKLFMTHHVISRMAQRHGMRTVDDMIMEAKAMWNTAAGLFNDEKFAIESVPDRGIRVPIVGRDGAVVILKRHQRWDKSLLAATTLASRDAGKDE
jgi:hypothetical protein